MHDGSVRRRQHTLSMRTALTKALILALQFAISQSRNVAMKRRRMLTMGESSRNRRKVSDHEFRHFGQKDMLPAVSPTRVEVYPPAHTTMEENIKPMTGPIQDQNDLVVTDPRSRQRPLPTAIGSDDLEEPPTSSRDRDRDVKKYKRHFKSTVKRGLMSSSVSYQRISSLDEIQRYQPLYPSATPTTLIHAPHRPIVRITKCTGFDC
jgi:hypothetical protein